VAVIPVVLYHFGVPGFGGGFVGVDVFFVISGFLITSLIYHEIAECRFTIANFYERRIRRIFPALFFLLFVVGIFAYFELLPTTFNRFGESVSATSIFLSNVEFWREAGYFDMAADQKPLLHTWSLAVEEQFYLIFPPLMILTARSLRGRYTAVFAVLFAASLGLSIWGTSAAPDSTFYLLPPRMWELLVGGLIAVGALSFALGTIAQNALGVAGLAMIGYAVGAYTWTTPFPGLAALPPCLGAALVILTGASGRTAVYRALSSGPMVFIGKISYSLYLWHWPVYVFAKYHLVRELTPVESATFIVISVGLATLSWRYIEQPFRGTRGVFSRPVLFLQAAAAMVLVGAYGATVYLTKGLPQRFPPDVLAYADAATEILPCNQFGDLAATACQLGRADTPPTFLAWGDSHARAMAPGLARAADEHHTSGVMFARDSCTPLLGVERPDMPEVDCRRHNDAVYGYLQAANIGTVVLISRWAANVEGIGYGSERMARLGTLTDDQSREESVAENHRVFARSLQRTIEILRKAGKRVIVVGPVPEVGFSVPEALAKLHLQGRSEDVGPTSEQFERRNRFVLDQLATIKGSAEVVYPHRILCTAPRCSVARLGKSLYMDDDHLSRFGAESISKIFDAVFDDRPRAYAPPRTQK
jgi:peptidoglycan/LPS O-acetylase OafA/YrhL